MRKALFRKTTFRMVGVIQTRGPARPAEVENATWAGFFGSACSACVLGAILGGFWPHSGHLFDTPAQHFRHRFSVRSSIFSFLLIFLKKRKCAYGLSAVHIST